VAEEPKETRAFPAYAVGALALTVVGAIVFVILAALLIESGIHLVLWAWP